MTPLEKGYVLAEEEGQAVWFLAFLETIKASSEQTQNAYSLHISTVPVGHGPALHIHHHQDEAFYVLDGRVSVRCGEQTWNGSTGAFFFLPRGIPHTFKVEGDTPLKMLVIASPGGTYGFDHFMQEMGIPALAHSMPPAEPINKEKLQQLATKYGIEFIEAI